MKIALVTDAWRPQTNGVVTTLTRTVEVLRGRGHEVVTMTPDGFRTIPCPSYPEIRLALLPRRRVAQWLDAEQPDALHIATEGPLGLAASGAASRRRLAFTTSYHTQFPQYVRARAPIPTAVTYAFLRGYHGRARRVLVGTETMRRDLVLHGFRNVVLWSRGVDTALFCPREDAKRAVGFEHLPGPILMYVGRVAVEKNIGAFLSLRNPGTKVVVGDGPARAALERQYPDVVFTGFRFGPALAAMFAAADAFVFPSRTDTFGLVMLEAMASGTPVAAYPVTGPLDVVRDGAGVLDADLGRAVEGALAIDRAQPRAYALGYSWDRATDQFFGHLVHTRSGLPLAA